MSDPAALVAEALQAKATEILVVPEKQSTRVRFVRKGGVTDHYRLHERDGQLLIDRLKNICGMPIGRDKALTGHGTLFANGTRVKVAVETSPYRDDFERASIRLRPT